MICNSCIFSALELILYLLGIALLIILILLGIRAFTTLKKVNDLIDDAKEKSTKLNGVFSIIDNTTDAISNASDRILDFIVSKVQLMFKKKKDKEDDSDE